MTRGEFIALYMISRPTMDHAAAFHVAQVAADTLDASPDCPWRIVSPADFRCARTVTCRLYLNHTGECRESREYGPSGNNDP
jgi:hypothetical protein